MATQAHGTGYSRVSPHTTTATTSAKIFGRNSVLPSHGIQLKPGVSLRHRRETAAVAGTDMLVIETTASAFGREECRSIVSRADGMPPRWYGGLSIRHEPAVEDAVDTFDEVILGPVESEALALRLIADQLAAHLASAMRSRQWYEPNPDLPDSGMGDHLLHSIRDEHRLELINEAFGEGDDEP
jgi:hypothetical protein